LAAVIAREVSVTRLDENTFVKVSYAYFYFTIGVTVKNTENWKKMPLKIEIEFFIRERKILPLNVNKGCASYSELCLRVLEYLLLKG